MSETLKAPFLVVASSSYMRGILKFVLETHLHTDVTELESEEKALQFLKNLDFRPSVIVYDYKPNAYLVEDFVGYLKDHSKNVRVLILVDEIREEGKELLKEAPQLRLLLESALPNNIIAEGASMFRDSNFINTDEYCRIDVDFLSILDGINKNLFIKIGNEKYIKLFHEDDNTNVVDIKKYKSKGINYLYLQRTTADWVINQIQNQIDIFLRSNNFRFILRGANESPEKRFEQKILRIADEVHIDKEFKETIDKAVERIRGAIGKDPKIGNYLNSLKQKPEDNAFFNSKINLMSLVSCAVAKQLDWISKATMDKLVYAAVLSDITLAVRPELLKINGIQEFEKQKEHLTEEEQKLFLTHPQDAANLIKKYFTSAPPDTDVLAYQHHEMPDGSGYPNSAKADKISPLSALFIICNDFTYYYLRDDEPSLEDYLLKSHQKFDFLNFRKIVKALESVRKK